MCGEERFRPGSRQTTRAQVNMTSLRKIGKKMPVFLFLYRKLRSAYVRRRYRSKDAEQVFNDIYRKNTWGGKESVSGTGSDKEQTEVLVNELPDLIRDLGIRTMLDIPCVPLDEECRFEWDKVYRG